MPDQFGGIEVETDAFGGVPVDSPEAETSTPPEKETSPLQYGTDVVLEAMAAVNRGAVDIADLPATLANAVFSLAGSETRVPLIAEQDVVKEGIVGGFMEEGLPRDIIRAGGEIVAPAPPIVAAGKQASQAFKKADDLATQAQRFTDEFVPTALPPAVIPGAKNAQEVVEAAQKGGLAQEFVANPKAPEMAEYVLREGKVVADPVAKQALKQGVDPGLVSMIKTASGETREKLAAMLKVVKRGRKDLRYQDRFRPWDIAGKSMADRVKYVKSVNRAAGKEVNQVAKGLAGQSVDYSPAIDNFLGELNDLGVMVVRGSNGKIKPDFSQSVFRSSNKPKKIIKDIISHLDTQNPVDAREAHIAKKYIGELVNWGKNATGNAGQVEIVAKGLRKGLNDALGDAFPAYRAANQKYKETLDVLENIAKSSGVKLDINDAGFDQALGTGLRRLLSNAQSKSVLAKAADDIETVASKYGASFSDDVRDQVSFANQLDAIFGPSAKTSLAGEEAKVAERVAQTAQQTAAGMTLEAGKEIYKKIQGVNEENAIKALETLISDF